jgi:hypothetical protein
MPLLGDIIVRLVIDGPIPNLFNQVLTSEISSQSLAPSR